MRVEVQFHEDVQHPLAAWQRGLSPDRGRRSELRDALLGVFRATVIEAEGPPAHAITQDQFDPPIHWVELSGGAWLGFIVRDRRAGILGRVVREVIVTQLAARPPL